MIVATKVAGPSGQMVWIRGGPARVDAPNISEAIDGSLRRLRTDYIDLFQIHWPDRCAARWAEVLATLGAPVKGCPAPRPAKGQGQGRGCGCGCRGCETAPAP